MTDAARPLYPRILLKLSGEALMGAGEYGLDPGTVSRLAAEVRSVIALGIQVCLVIGGGNIFRGVIGAASGIERASADNMGMLATVMNAIAVQDVVYTRRLIEAAGIPVELVSGAGTGTMVLEAASGHAARPYQSESDL